MNKFFNWYLGTRPHNIKIYNSDKLWSINKLYITGLAGVGKTTISDNLKGLFPARIIHTDEVREEIKKNALNHIEYRQNFKKYMEEVINSEERLIIEGASLMHLDNEWLAAQPLMIINKPIIVCLVGFIRRQYKSGSKLSDCIIHGIILMRRGSKRSKRLHQYLKGKYIESYNLAFIEKD